MSVSTMNNMKPDILHEWPRWRDELIYRLRRQGMTGDQVGEVLTEILAYTNESGESPVEAFGAPKTYADSRVLEPNPIGWTNLGTLAEIAAVLLGGGMMFWSAVLIGQHDTWPLGIHPLVGTFTGLVILFFTIRHSPRDTVRDPRTGEPLMGNHRQKEFLALLVFVILGFIPLVVQLILNLRS